MLSRIFFKLILLCLLLTFFNQLFFKSAVFIALIQPTFIILAVIWTSIPLAISSVILWPKACKYFKIKLICEAKDELFTGYAAVRNAVQKTDGEGDEAY